jgi:hypothetical protein
MRALTASHAMAEPKFWPAWPQNYFKTLILLMKNLFGADGMEIEWAKAQGAMRRRVVESQ